MRLQRSLLWLCWWALHEQSIWEQAAAGWKCAGCLVVNKETDAKCPCCEAPNPNKPAATSASNGAGAGGATAEAAPVSIWEQAAAGWKCAGCLVVNKDTDAKCPCCEAPNPNKAAAAASSTSATPAAPSAFAGFTFGVAAGATGAATAPTAGGGLQFNFGTGGSTAAAPAPAATGGFVFGFPAAGAGGASGGVAPLVTPSANGLAFNFATPAVTVAATPASPVKPATTDGAADGGDSGDESDDSPAGKAGGGSSSAEAAPVIEDAGPITFGQQPRFDFRQPVTPASVGGEVYTFGTGDCDQLGHDDEEFTQLKPRLVKALQGVAVARIAVGGMHTLALTNAGVLYSWGCNDDAALGRGGKENCPGLVEGLAGVFITQVRTAATPACCNRHPNVHDEGSPSARARDALPIACPVAGQCSIGCCLRCVVLGVFLPRLLAVGGGGRRSRWACPVRTAVAARSVLPPHAVCLASTMPWQC